MREAKNALCGQRRGEGSEEAVEDNSDGWTSKLQMEEAEFVSKLSCASKSVSQSFDTTVFSKSSGSAITELSSNTASSASRTSSASVAA